MVVFPSGDRETLGSGEIAVSAWMSNPSNPREQGA